MFGTDFDSLTGQWAAQGPNLYVLGRIHNRPDLPVNQILAEYYEGFGPAKDSVEKYFEHWEKVSDRVTQDYYDKGWKSHGISDNPEHRFYRWCGYIFTPEVMAEGRLLLNRAKAASRADSTARKRVAFLEKGLTHAELTLAVQKADRSRFDQALETLMKYRGSVEGDFIANMGYLRQKESNKWN
jgi:hypothetical protein